MVARPFEIPGSAVSFLRAFTALILVRLIIQRELKTALTAWSPNCGGLAPAQIAIDSSPTAGKQLHISSSRAQLIRAQWIPVIASFAELSTPLFRRPKLLREFPFSRRSSFFWHRFSPLLLCHGPYLSRLLWYRALHF